MFQIAPIAQFKTAKLFQQIIIKYNQNSEQQIHHEQKKGRIEMKQHLLSFTSAVVFILNRFQPIIAFFHHNYILRLFFYIYLSTPTPVPFVVSAERKRKRQLIC